jgi:hypothetical protein
MFVFVGFIVLFWRRTYAVSLTFASPLPRELCASCYMGTELKEADL